VINGQAAPMALPAVSFPFRNGKQSKAQRAAAMPLPFGLPFQVSTHARELPFRAPAQQHRAFSIFLTASA